MTELESLAVRVRDVLERAGFSVYLVDEFDDDSGVSVRFDVWEEN